MLTSSLFSIVLLVIPNSLFGPTPVKGFDFSSLPLKKYFTQDTKSLVSAKTPVQKPLGELLNDVKKMKIENVYFSNDMRTIISHIKNDPTEKTSITVSNPFLTPYIVQELHKDRTHIEILPLPVNPFLEGFNQGFPWIFWPTLLFLSLRNAIQFTKLSKKNIPSSTPSTNNPFSWFGGLGKKTNEQEWVKKANITLASWAGSPEIFEECTEVVSYLRNSSVYKAAGAEIPKGILLEGPPGTGKTLLAKAIASEADAYFISISASEFVELYVGMGASKVRSLFQQAREHSPAIIFIDEIDTVGKKRGAGSMIGGNDEREQTLNQLLSEMDGFSPNEGILVLAATNRKDVLDSALLRPGRFDRIINIPLPNRDSRKAILETYLKNKQVADDVQVNTLAEMTAGFSGAEIKNLLNEAAIFAARKGETVITQQYLEEAFEKGVVGLIQKKETRTDEALRRVAVHEMGHAFLANQYPDYFELKKISIQNTYNGAGGYTLFQDRPDILENGLYTKDMLKKRLVVLMGGKAAEKLYYGTEFVSAGATQDLKQANEMAHRMIRLYGMGEVLETIYKEDTTNASERVKEEIDMESSKLINEAFEEAYRLLETHRKKMDEGVDRLIQLTTWLPPFDTF